MINKNLPNIILRILLVSSFLFVLIIPNNAYSDWPDDTDWIAMEGAGGGLLWDVVGDTANSRDIVGDSTHASAYSYTDGTYLYYRVRLDDDPTQSDALQAFGWGFLIDTDQDNGDYEWMVMIDGITDEIYIAQNTVQGTIGDPSDKAELVVWSEDLNNDPVLGNFKVSVTTDGPTPGFDNDDDYFLDFRIPFDTFINTTGINDNDPIRYFIGSSNSAQTLSADLVAGALSNSGVVIDDGVSETVTSSGTTPTTGLVEFVDSLLEGASPLTTSYPTDTLYVRVTDLDLNTIASEAQTVTLTVTSDGGDVEFVTLTETGVDTGIFTGSIVTTGDVISTNDGTLQVNAIEIVAAHYLDAIDGDLNQDRGRHSYITISATADVGVTKSVSNLTPNPGDQIIYTITVHNYGPSTATNIHLTDNLPSLTNLIFVSDDVAQYNEVTGEWTIASIDSGSEVSMNITVEVDPATPAYTEIINNIAVTTLSEPDLNSANDSASVAINISGADVALAKSVDNNAPNELDTITYVVTVTNGGDATATSLVVSDSLPAGVTYSSDSPSQGSYVSGTGLWDVGTLANGASATLTLTVIVDGATSGSTIINTASVSDLNEGDPDSTNNTATADILVGGADIVITKIVDNSSPNIGDTVTYTVTAYNAGPNTATTVSIFDDINTLSSYLTNCTAGSVTQGSYDFASGLWLAGNLGNGQSEDLTISCDVNTGTGGSTVTNNAWLNYMEPIETDDSDNSDSATFIVQSADLEVTKIVDTLNPNPGDIINYTITVYNNGPSDADNVELFDELHSKLSLNSYAATQGTYSTVTDTWTIGTIAADTTVTLTLNVTVASNQTANKTFNNTATITASDQYDPETNNNGDSVEIAVTGVDVGVSKTVNISAPQPGDTVTYTITVTNFDAVNAVTTLKVADSLPGGVTFAGGSISQGSYNSGSGIWGVGTLTAGASAWLNIDVTVDAGTEGDIIQNSARYFDSDQGDYNEFNDTDYVDIYVSGSDLILTKSVDELYPGEGDLITYSISVYNEGPNISTSIEVTETLPSIEATYFDGCTYSPSVGTYDDVTGIWYNNGTLAVLATQTLSISCTVKAGSSGSVIVNSADITAANYTSTDLDTSNDYDNVIVQVMGADVSVIKTGDNATPDEGDLLTYTVTVFNNGPATATSLVIEDVLPVGVTYDGVGNPATATQGSYDGGTGLWSVGTLAKDGSATLTLPAFVDSGTGDTNITNTASVYSMNETDTVTLNDSAVFTITPTVAPNLVFTKEILTISDPINAVNPKAIPGATVRYTLTVDNTGGGTAEAVSVTDAIPVNATYTTGSLVLDGGGLSDVDGDDQGDFNVTNPGGITVDFGDLPGSTSFSITFEVTVD